MDLRLTPEQAEFADAAGHWLQGSVPTEALPPMHTADGLAAHRQWEHELLAVGYAALQWPEQFGGAGLDPVHEWIFQDEYIRSGAPTRLNRLGLGLIGPAIMQFGSPEQQARWLPPLLSCAELWCQGFSEPEAGSDLASVRTTARRDGDDYAVNGQKTWTSLAVWSDWMFALVRTTPGSRGRDGLTMLLVPMAADGVEVRPLHQLHGAVGFAEVFLTDVRVPAANVLGTEGAGWRVATTALGYERGGGIAHSARFLRHVDRLVTLARATGRDAEPLVRDAIAARHAEAVAFRRFEQHQLSLRARGREIGTSGSLAKLTWSEMESRILETALDIAGPPAEVIDDPAVVGMGDLHHDYWHARASRIFAGTNEVQRNIVAERVLGLPREPPWTSN